MANRIQYRRDTAANWTAANPVLALGEPGYETDTGRMKIGDGSTAWLSLLPAIGRPRNTFCPEDYGAKGDGTNDDTAAVQAMFNAIPAGAEVRLSKVYYIPGGVTVSKQVKITGNGTITNALGIISGFTTNSTTVTALTINSSGNGAVILRDFAVVNTSTSTPTAGAGILFTGTGSGDFAQLNNITIQNFYNGLQINSGFYYSVTDCHVYDPVNYGMYFKSDAGERFDHGDQSVTGCVISRAFVSTRANGTAVRWESGGGLRFVNNKINGGEQPTNTSAGKFQFGLYLSVADGGSTSVLTVTGNSIENCTSQNVRVDQQGTTGYFSKVVITGNEIAIGATGVWLQGTSAGYIKDAMVDGNVFTDLSTSVYTKYVDGVTVGSNHHTAVSSPISFDTGTTNFSMAKQNVKGDSLQLFYDNNVANTSHGPFGLTRQDWDREIPSTTSSSTYTALWNLQMPQNSAGIIDLTLAGYVVGVGNFALQAKRAYQMGTGSVTMTTVGTDTAVGAVVDIAFDTTTTAGWCLVKLKLNVAGGTDIAGRASLAITGPIYKVRKGT